MFVLIPKQVSRTKIGLENMHDQIKTELNNLNIDNFQSLQRVWLPQFSIGREHRTMMEKNNEINGYKLKVETEDLPLQMLEYQEQQAFQLCAMPISEGNLIFEQDEFYDDNLSLEQNDELRHQSNGKLKVQEVTVADKEFYIAMIHD